MPGAPYGLLAATFAATLTVCGCSPDVVVQPPPPEERWVSPFPPPLDSWFAMSEADADRYVVSGIREIGSEGGAWLDGRGVVKVLVPPFLDLNFRLEFTLTDSVLRKAGEVKVRIFADGEPFTTAAFDKPGEHLIEKPVPAGGLPWDRNTEIAIEIEAARERNWGPRELGFRITSVGFH